MGRQIEIDGEMVDLSEVEPDPRTGKPRAKKKSVSKKAGKSAEKSASGRKVYKVHKYKKSATSKAARSAQGKGRRKKK